MLKQPVNCDIENLDFSEALKDSPKFRYQLALHESSVIFTESKIKEVVKQFNQFVDLGHRYINAFQNALESLRDLNESCFTYDSQVVCSIESVRDMFNEFCSSQKVLVEQAYWTIVKNLNDFLKRDFHKAHEMRTHFQKLSQNLDEALIRSSQVSRHKEQDASEASNELTAVGTCFAHTALDYVFQLNLLRCRQKFEVVEALGGFLNACRTFAQQCNRLLIFASQNQLSIDSIHNTDSMNNDKFDDVIKSNIDLAPTITQLKQQARVSERKMQDRHMLVPKEIFQHPPGMPTDPDVVMEGYLFKRATNAFKTWNRRWFVIKDGKLLYCHRDLEIQQNTGRSASPSTSHIGGYTVMEPDLRLCLVRQAQNNNLDRRNCFELVTPTKVHVLQADSDSLCKAWIKALQRSIESALHDSTNQNTLLLADSKPSPDMMPVTEILSHKKSDQSASSSNQSISATSTNQQRPRIINAASLIGAGGTLSNANLNLKGCKSIAEFLTSVAGNELCADCQAFNPKWASVNLGVTLCIECCAIHRSMGVQVSKVRSLTLDAWEPEHIRLMELLGNEVVNKVYLAKVANSPVPLAAKPDSSRAVREAWIKAKYVKRKFIDKNPKRSLIKQLFPHFKTKQKRKLMLRTNRALSTQEGGGEKVANLPKSASFSDLDSLDNVFDNPDLDSSVLGIQNTNFLGLNCKETHFGSESVLNTSGDEASVSDEFTTTRENTMLLDGCKQADLKLMCKALSLGACVNFSCSTLKNTTCLHQAIASGSSEACEYLLLNGARINVQDSDGRTPLHIACEMGHTAQVCQLLKRGANQDVTTVSGKSALDIVMDSMNADIVTLLRLARLNDEIKEADVLNPGDETFADVVRDFSHIASNRPEVLKRQNGFKN